MRITFLIHLILLSLLIFSPESARAETSAGSETQQIYLPAPMVPTLSVDGKGLFNGVPVKAVIADPNPSAPRRRIPAPTGLATAPEAATASFSITYVPNGGTDLWGEPCYTFPESAKAAFSAAANIWANTISSAVPVTINACWANLGSSSTLGYSGGGNLYRDFPGAPRANTWFAASLANSLSGSDRGPGLFDMHITYNQNFTWYYGTDGNTPAGQYDLMTVVLHEIAHGLNFSGTMQYSGGTGSWGYGTGYPGIYDVFMRDGSGRQLISTYSNGSVALGSALVSNNIWFHGTEAMASNGSQRVKMYAPSSWSGGSSYSHLDYITFNNTPNQLMVYAVSDGESIHDPGAVTKGLFRDLGWTVSGPPPPPGTVSASDGTYTDKIRLTWSAVPGATQYNVYYAPSLTGTKNYVGSTTGTTIDFTDAAPEDIYYFWVAATNSWGEGVLSSPDTGYMAGIYYTVSVSRSGNGLGAVMSTPTGISCGSDCSESYLSGTSVILSATANTGSTASWNDCVTAGGTPSANGTTVATCTLSGLNANKTVIATFTLNTYMVTANAGGFGTGTVSSNEGGINYTYPGTSTATTSALNYGSSIILTAVAGTDSRVSWSGCTSIGGTSTAATCTFSSLDGNQTVTATFVPTCYQDSDRDTYGSAVIIEDDGDGVCETVDGESTVNTDCNDSNAGINPGATELAGDGVDQNCDTLELCYVDMDDDGYRPDSTSTKVSTDMDCLDSTEAVSSDPTGDCNDNAASVNPGAAEICDGVDNDCNSSIDDNLFAPANTFQQGVCSGSTQICAGVSGWEDDYSGIGTYEAGNETSCDTLDNDCDGSVDETLTTTYYQDSDRDTYGNPLVSQDVCLQPTGYILDNTDCNDTNVDIHPGATEVAGDGVDQNCDAQELCYVDMDDDGYRPDGTSTKVSTDMDCLDSTEAVSSDPTGDCNDNAASVNPGAAEICDGVDNDCNSSIDDNLFAPANTFQQGVCSGSTQICAGVSGWEDDYSGIGTYEAGNETSCDTLDNDCDGSVDETLTTIYYQDADRDTYGNPSVSQDVCVQPAGYILDNTDCNDTNADINPAATEICDSIDNNCDAQIDENKVCSEGFWLLMMPIILNGAGTSH